MKYGDYDNVTKDSKVLNEILSRQGTSIFLEIIAEHIGQTNLKFKLSDDDSTRLMNNILTELKADILERI